MTRWRADGSFTSMLASKAGLLAETRLYLQLYGQSQDASVATAEMVDVRLTQPSRATRATIMTHIRHRVATWGPPDWVMTDLVAFADDADESCLKAALLHHAARQDALLYDFVRRVVWAKWVEGDVTIKRTDAARFLDAVGVGHPEVDRWSHETRRRVAGGLLSILHDYGLLRGGATRTIVEPEVPEPVATHLVRLLLAEGIAGSDISAHPDWSLWLWDERRARAAVLRYEEAMSTR